jgi:hypothetical protein
VKGWTFVKQYVHDHLISAAIGYVPTAVLSLKNRGLERVRWALDVRDYLEASNANDLSSRHMRAIRMLFDPPRDKDYTTGWQDGLSGTVKEQFTDYLMEQRLVDESAISLTLDLRAPYALVRSEPVAGSPQRFQA